MIACAKTTEAAVLTFASLQINSEVLPFLACHYTHGSYAPFTLNYLLAMDTQYVVCHPGKRQPLHQQAALTTQKVP
jgi:hypothetical protein